MSDVEVPDPDLRGRGRLRHRDAGGHERGDAGARHLLRPGGAARREAPGRRGARAHANGDQRARGVGGDRRSLRRDEGGPRRLLRDRRTGPRHSPGRRQDVPGPVRGRRGPSGDDVRLSMDSSAVAAAVADAHRREWAFVLAATVRVTRDLDVAEECAQDAFAAALTDWRSSGIPERPGAWLTTTARRRALNVLRHRRVEHRHLPLLVEDETVPGPADLLDDRPQGAQIPDDRLRLIVTCCHPALDRSAQVALTLRLMCGLSTAEVARAFLVSEPTMAARITRAKKKIAVARIPYRVPAADELPDRVDAVLSVVHLLFTTGHTTPAGEDLVRRDLVERSVQLCRMLRALLPQDPAVAGLLALLLLTDARRETRTAPDGRLLLLEEQDRSRWDHRAIREGAALVRESLRSRPPNR